MATHQDTQESSGGVWKFINTLIGLGFGGFALLAGGALIYGQFVIRSGGDTKPAEKPLPVVTKSTPAGAPAADAALVTIKPDAANPLMYDTKAFTVKAGQPVKLTFDNPKTSPLQHNIIVGKLGAKDKLVAGAMAIGTDPNGMAKGYIFESPEILAHTKLLSPGQTETLEFTAPAEPGDYPYICSFPGHYMMMFGTMTVK